MLSELLNESTVCPSMQATGKMDVLNAMLDMLCNTGKVQNRDQAMQDLLDNDRRTSVGMQHGIAIPHAKSATVSEMIACVAVTAEPVDMQSLDGQPSRIFIMTLSPPERTGPHIRFLAEIGRVLKDKKRRESILQAATRAELLEVFVSC